MVRAGISHSAAAGKEPHNTMFGSLNVHVEQDTFEPAMMSLPELKYALDHLGESPSVALYNLDPVKHPGIIRSRLETLLARVYELQELHTHRDVEWAGIEAVSDSITRYLDWHERVQEMKRRGFKKGEPSQFHWDEVGEAYKYAIGADSAECVRTEIADDGSRRPFGVKLTMTPTQMMAQDLSDVAPWINRGKHKVRTDDKLEEAVNGRMGTIRCTICSKTEEFDAANRQARVAARGRMGKHLKNARQEKHRHLLLYRKTYK